MVAPIDELIATCRECPVPSALPSRECECEMLTVEAPIWSASTRIHRRWLQSPSLVTVNSQQRWKKDDLLTVDCQQSTKRFLREIAAIPAWPDHGAGSGQSAGRTPSVGCPGGEEV